MAINFLNNGYFANRVGIGVESPLTTLHLYDAGGSVLRLASNAHTDNNKIEFDAVNNGAIYHSIVSNTSSGNLQIRAGDGGSGHEVNIYTDGLFVATFSQDQKLGVGTVTPGGKLDIAYSGTGGTGTQGIGEGLNITSLTPNITFNDNSSNVSNYAIHLNQNVFTLGTYTSATSQSPDLVLVSGRVGIGTNNPTNTDYGSVDPKLHVYTPGTAGAFDLVARFEAGNDSNDTGGAILINHSNDRGLLIEGGRGGAGTVPDDDAVGYLGLVRSSGAHTRILTLKEKSATNSSLYAVGIGTTTPEYKLDVDGDIRARSNIRVFGNNLSSIPYNTPSETSVNMGTYVNQYAYLDLASSSSGGSWIDFSDATGGDYGGRIRYHNGNDQFQFFTNTTQRMTISSTGLVQFNAYGAGTLVTDASGNITVSSGGGAGGPYLPLTAGPSKRLTGNLYIDNTAPIIVLNDTNATVPTDAIGYISFQIAGSEKSWLGWGSNSNNDFTVNAGVGSDLILRSNNVVATSFDSSQNATFTGNVSTAADKRISIGTWDNSAFTSGNAYGYYVSSSTPMLLLEESNQSKTGYVGVSGGNMYVGGVVTNLILQSGSGSNALTIDSSQNATFAGRVNAVGFTSTSSNTYTGGMSTFETTLTSNDDYLNSPISILERGNVQGTQTADKYAPNLNFHWGAIVSNSLWMGSNGNLNYGSYDTFGIPGVDGTFAAGNLTAASAITGNTGAFTGQVTGPTPTTSTSFANKAYVDTTASGAANWASIGAGTRSNYTLGFQPPSTGYAGFFFNKSDGNGAGYLLVRGGADSDVYKQGGITLVGDGGTLTIATRTSASNVIRFMTGATSVERLNITGTGAFSFGNSVTNYGTSGQVMTSNGNATPGWTTINTGVQSVGGTANRISSSGGTAPVIDAITGTVSINSTNLATGAQIQTAINNAVTGVLKYEGVWNANTNSPSLSSGSGTVGEYYIVSVAGSTNLDGITDWAVGDWAVFSDQATDAWQKIDNTQVGNVTGSGSSGRVAYWNSNSNITSDADLTFDGSNLTVGGNLTVTGNQYFNGQFIEGDGKEMFRYNDDWLRINEDIDFSSGIYCGTGVLRTDGQFQVGSSGQYAKITSVGVATFATLATGGTLTVSGNTTLSGTTNTISGNTLFGGYTRLGGRLVNQYIAGLSASGQQARQYEIARAFMDYNDWNNTGVIKINLMEQYFDEGIGKEYAIRWGYSNTFDIDLINIYGGGDNATGFECVVGTLTQIGTSDIYYLPIIVKVRYYAQVGALVTTNRSLTTNATSTSGGVIYINPSPTAVNISDFSVVDSVEFSGPANNINLGTASTKVGIGFADATLPTQALDVNANMRLRGRLYDVNNSQGGSGDVLVSTGSGVDWVSASTPGTGTFLPIANPTFTGTLTGPNANFTSTVTIDNMLTINIDDISTGENRGLRLINEAGTDQQWNITAGTTGITNDDFCIRDATNNVNAFRLSESTGDATFAGNISLASGWTLQNQSGGYAKFSNWVNIEGTGFYTTSDLYMDLDDSSSRFVVRGTGNTEIFVINTAASNAATFAGLVSGITPVNAANFTTKAYVDGSIPSLANYVTLNTTQTITGTKVINTLAIGTSAKIQFQNNDFIRFDDTANRFHFDVDGGTSNASVQAAAFVGDLNGTINTATTGTTQTAGNNSTLIATTAYADAAAAAVPIGNYLPLAGGTLTGGLVGTFANFSQGVYDDSSGIRVVNPGGGSRTTQDSSTTGAIKITLPVSWTNTMLRMTIKVYEYTTNESFTVVCGGYNYSPSTSWYNTFAYIESSAKLDRNFTVRFGHDGSKCCIYIGELTSGWTYTQVFVTDVQIGYSGLTGSAWRSGWVVGFEASAFGTITQTEVNPQVNNWARSGSNLYYGSAGGSVTVPSLISNGNLTVGGNSFLGNANGDYVHVNDKLYVGATDSGNAEFWFGEGTTGDVNYGARWYWDSSYTHQWFTVNSSTETLMMSYATNDTSKVQWFRNFDMNNNKITELATPTAGTDAANKTYVDTAVAGAGSGTFLPLTGGTLTGAFYAEGSLPTTPGMSGTGVGLGQAFNYAHAQFSGSVGGYIDFSEPNVDWSGRIIYTHSSDSMVFYTAATTVLTLDSSNNATFTGNVTVGANTTQNGANPGLKIQSTNTAQTVLGLHNSTTRNWEVAVGGSANGIGAGSFYVYDNTASDARLEIDTSGNTTFAGDVTIGDELTITTILNATADPDKFLCASGGNKVFYRTGAQVLSDIGGVSSSGVTSVATGGGLDGGTITTTGTIEVEYTAVPTNIIQSGFDFTGDTVVSGDYIMISDPGSTSTNRRIGYVTVGDLPFTNNSGDITNVTAGTGMTGGGSSGSVTLNVIGGSGINANASDIAVDSTVIRTTGNQTITGNKEFAPSSTSTGYANAAVELRESNYSGSSGAPPRISWHWGGVVASSMTIEANGTLAVRNNPGTAYEQFACGNLKAHGGVFVLGSGGVGDMYIGNYATNKYFRFHTNNNQTYFDMNCGQINWREGSSTRYYFYPSTANMTINGTLTQNSDSRVKENVVEIDNCINKVQAMRGVYYNRTDFNTEVTKVGVIAQEVEAVLPELILEASDTGLKSVAYAELTAVLINAIKEQQEIIEDLKTRIIKLEK